MKIKHTIAADANAVNNSSNPNSGKNRLCHFIRLALVGSVLTSGVASAVLQDHGPADPVLSWPAWYRDTNGLAIGLCKSIIATPAAYCFPPKPDPAGFAGNIGPEMFYNMVEFKDPNAAAQNPIFQFHYLGGLEASYLPAGVPVHGTETVFARVRISFNFTDPAKNGTYTVTHPFGKQVFQNVQATNTTNFTGAQAAIFFTADVPLGIPLDYNAALSGPIGPFIQWDSGLPLINSAGESFVGDPAVAHTFTGSPFGTNFLRIDGPPGSGIGFDANGQPQDFILITQGNVIGQIWTQAIAQPLSIDAAYMTRTASTNGIDVWATSASTPVQKLIVTGDGGMPSMQMLPDGTTTGKYHAHIEYPSSLPIPAQVTVTNQTVPNNPLLNTSVSSVVKDVVGVTTANFDTSTRKLTFQAHSSDFLTNPTLTVQGIPGVPSAPGALVAVTGTMTACAPPLVYPNDVCFSYPLPANLEPPTSVTIQSSDLGGHSVVNVQGVGAPENLSPAPVATNFTGAGFTVKTVGATALTSTLGTLPLDALIIQQPVNGTVTLVNGVWTFTANASAVAGLDKFSYVRQTAAIAPAIGPVSSLATANLTLTFNATAPTAVADQFGAQNAVSTKLNILNNDKPASANPLDNINPASVTIVTAPTRGTLTKNADGTVNYTPNSTTADFFTYTVKNSSTPALTSNVARVDITNFGGAESVAVTSKYTIAKTRWVITGTTTWTVANKTATCWVGTGLTPTATTLIGSAPILVAGGAATFTVDVTGGPTGVNNQLVTCQTTNGGKGVGATAAK